MTNEMICNCTEYACKWIQKISEYSQKGADIEYALERLNAIRACTEFEIKLLGQKGLKSFINKVAQGNPGLFTNHKKPIENPKVKLDKDITQ